MYRIINNYGIKEPNLIICISLILLRQLIVYKLHFERNINLKFTYKSTYVENRKYALSDG